MPTILANLPADTRRRVFADDFAALETLGDVVFFDPKNDDPAHFPGLVARADALLTGWGSRGLSPDDLGGARERPLLVAHSAGSVRGVMPKELLGGTVRLSQSAPAISTAVAQYTVGLMILALRQAVARMSVLRETGKGDNRSIVYRDLGGLTIGLVGLSQVGRRVPPLLAPFGVGEILAYDPYFPASDAADLGAQLTPDLDDLIARSDVLSLHTPVTPETHNLIDARRVGLLRPGSVVVNTARAQIIDQDALFARAIKGDLQVYVDVTAPEPLPPGHTAWRSPNIFITPHIAGPTQQTLHRIGQHAIAEIGRFLQGAPLEAEVTVDRYDILA